MNRDCIFSFILRFFLAFIFRRRVVGGCGKKWMGHLNIRQPNAPLHLHTESLFSSFLTLCQQKSSQSFSKVVSHCSTPTSPSPQADCLVGGRGVADGSHGNCPCQRDRKAWKGCKMRLAYCVTVRILNIHCCCGCMRLKAGRFVLLEGEVAAR